MPIGIADHGVVKTPDGHGEPGGQYPNVVTVVLLVVATAGVVAALPFVVPLRVYKASFLGLGAIATAYFGFRVWRSPQQARVRPPQAAVALLAVCSLWLAGLCIYVLAD